MKVIMFCLGAFMATCAAIGWCCARVGSDHYDNEA